MKRFIAFMLITFNVSQLYSQNGFFNDSLRHELKIFLVNHKDAGYPDEYGPDNLYITNLLTMRNIDNALDKAEYGIYSFKAFGSHNKAHILLKKKQEYAILEMNKPLSNRSYDDIITDLLIYFRNNPDIDQCLLPYYNEAVYKVFINNSMQDQRGKWYDWHSKEKYRYMKDGL